MISLPEHLEQPFLHIAESEHIAADKLLEQVIADYLTDYHDVLRAEQAIKRIEDGEDSLLDWQDVKAGLYDVAD
jgi:predicted DNA-binding protein